MVIVSSGVLETRAQEDQLFSVVCLWQLSTLLVTGFPQFTLAPCEPYKQTKISGSQLNVQISLYFYRFSCKKIKFLFRQEIGHVLGNVTLQIIRNLFAVDFLSAQILSQSKQEVITKQTVRGKRNYFNFSYNRKRSIECDFCVISWSQYNVAEISNIVGFFF